MQALHVETSDTRTQENHRYRWMIGLLVPFIPLLALVLYRATGWTVFAYLTPIVVFGLIPLADVVIGVDDDNLSDEVMATIASSRYYRRIVQAFVPFQYVSFLVGLHTIAQPETAWLVDLGFAISVGIIAGVGINAAHELGHKSEKSERWLSRISLAQSAYGHFYVEHNRGHHRNVATPEDPATARYGESFYRFWFRTVGGSIRSAWELESRRLERTGHRSLHWRNHNLQSWLMTVLLFGSVISWLGTSVWWALALQAVIGFSLLEVVNYLEHYGLERNKLPNGRYEACRSEHSWNSNYRITNVFLYHLQRHSDHHANPTRPYQLLRNADSAPNLPLGYASMVLAALVPPVWFRLMNPRVDEIRRRG